MTKKKISSMTLGEVKKICSNRENCVGCELQTDGVCGCVTADHNYPSDWELDDEEVEV